MNIDEWIAMAQEIAHNFEKKGKTDDMMRWLILCGYLHELKARRNNEEILQEYAEKGWTFIDPDEMRLRIKEELDSINDEEMLPAFEAYEIIDKIMKGLKKRDKTNDRDCENCKNHVEKGCKKWDCSFEPKEGDALG
jgi:hypothetical protein